MAPQKLNWRQEAFIQRFENKDSIFFHKVMSRSTVGEGGPKGSYAHGLEFPTDFLQKYAHRFDEDATLVCKSRQPDSKKEWPFGITVRKARNFCSLNNNRVFAYGNNGWRVFVKENEIKVGDMVVFQLIGYSLFRAYILPGRRQ